jgi:hypothetical protein
MSTAPANAPTGPGGGLRSDTLLAKMELEDNVTNYYHRVNCYESKQTTRGSIGNTLTLVPESAVFPFLALTSY